MANKDLQSNKQSAEAEVGVGSTENIYQNVSFFFVGIICICAHKIDFLVKKNRFSVILRK